MNAVENFLIGGGRTLTDHLAKNHLKRSAKLNWNLLRVLASPTSSVLWTPTEFRKILEKI